jgi:hypothetical protein
VRIQIYIAGSEDETAAQLERIPAGAMLAKTGCACTLPRPRIVGAENVKDTGRPEARGAIGNPLLVDQEWKGDAGLVAKKSGIIPIAKADSGERSALLAERWFMFAQLRDVLAAEDSAIVPEEHNNGRLPLPKRAQPEIATVHIRQDDVCQCLAQRVCHSMVFN